jgi:hypothetical protein
MALLSQGRRQSRRRRPAAGHTRAASPGPVRRPLAEGQAPFAEGSASRPRRVSDGELGAHRAESTAFDEKASGAGMACTPRAAIRRDGVERRVHVACHIPQGSLRDAPGRTSPEAFRCRNACHGIGYEAGRRTGSFRRGRRPLGGSSLSRSWSRLSLGMRRPGRWRNCLPAPAARSSPCSKSVRRGVSAATGAPHARSKVLGPDRHA